MASRIRGMAANVLTVAAVLLLAWWLLRGVVRFFIGLVTFVVLIGVAIVLLSLADRVRGKD